jgi:hypothetical protein
MSTEIDVGGDNDFTSLYNNVRVNTEKESICLIEEEVFNLMRYPETPIDGGEGGPPVTSEANPHMTIPKVIIALLLGLKNNSNLSGSSAIVFTLNEDSDSNFISVYFGVLGGTVLLCVEQQQDDLCCLESYQDIETGEVSLENINQIWFNNYTLQPQFPDGENYTLGWHSTTGQMSLTDFATMITKQYIVPESKNNINRVSAVLMSGHSRLGKHSPLHALDPGLLAMIIQDTEMLPGPTVQAAMERLGVVFG